MLESLSSASVKDLLAVSSHGGREEEEPSLFPQATPLIRALIHSGTTHGLIVL